MKEEVVDSAGRLMVCGMVLLALTVACTLMLILTVVLDGALVAGGVVGGVMLWFALCWYAVPYRLLRRAAQRRGPSEADDGADSADRAERPDRTDLLIAGADPPERREELL
ncbi:DUF6328 family protein [Streptomyces sp. NPDC059491]|uniref:DUF6328 family protein n=1 Tax=Streptomyces sp. NPDC059491 TaxID=3346850 RepID=UPI0036C37650